MLKIDVEPLAPKLLNNRTVHSDCLGYTQEQVTILREVVEQGKSQNPLNNSLDHASPPHSTQKNKVEAHPRTAKSSLKNKNCAVEPKGTASAQHSKINANFELICVKCNACMLFDNHDLCVLNDVNACAKSKSVKKNSKRKVWKPTGKVPSRNPVSLEMDTPKPVITLVYSRKPRKPKSTYPVSKSKVVQFVPWYLDSGCCKHTNFVNRSFGTVKFGNDHVAKIMGYGDYQIGNVTISK
nr:hypothetical protein [Tanacetum cinerariifolium]